jgi:hypothetical protein
MTVSKGLTLKRALTCNNFNIFLQLDDIATHKIFSCTRDGEIHPKEKHYLGFLYHVVSPPYWDFFWFFHEGYEVDHFGLF